MHTHRDFHNTQAIYIAYTVTYTLLNRNALPVAPVNLYSNKKVH